MKLFNSTRRGFLKGAAAGIAFSTVGCSEQSVDGIARSVDGSLTGADRKRGHKVKENEGHAEIKSRRKIKTLIVGGGVAGLSCAYELNNKGYKDFILLELEEKVGGNARSGKNEYSKYPLGAHYITPAGSENKELLRFHQDIGLIDEISSEGDPSYNYKHSIFHPVERIFTGKQWLVGEGDLYEVMTKEEQLQQHKFSRLVEKMTNAKGVDERYAFIIPSDMSSRDENYTKLDRISFAEYLANEGLNALPLMWYLDYCCRDDFGLGIEKISAWAGLHYFCSRKASKNAGGGPLLFTWSEGNNWLVNKLREPVSDKCYTGMTAQKVVKVDGSYEVYCHDHNENTSIIIECESIVMATPKMVNQHVLRGIKEYKEIPEYAPWVVATLTVENFDQDMAWDNFNYLGQGLGYINDQHKTRNYEHKKQVITYYWPISHIDSKIARRWMLTRSRSDWNYDILKDLESMHPGIAKKVERIDVHLWGHGMASPTTGSLWSGNREDDNKSIGKIHFAHSDMSGMSIFEEAFYWGNLAAKKVIVG